MKKKLLTVIFLFSVLGLQGCATQLIGAAASATVAVASVPVKMGSAVAGAAAGAATSAIIDSVIK